MESMLLFRAGSPQPKAVPLSLVTRLEEIDPKSIETTNDRAVVQYRGQLMPLVPVNGDVRIKSSGSQPLLVFSDEGRSMALMVDEIVDIVEERLQIELASSTRGRSRLGGHQGPGDRGDRHRPLPAAGVRGLAALAAPPGQTRRRIRCCWSTMPRSSATC